MSDIQIVDGARLLASPPTPIVWAVRDILPAGTVGDVFGPPGDGKSSITLDLAIAVASGVGTWFGLQCTSGPVVLLGGERSGNGAFARDLHRAVQGRSLDPGMLLLPQDDHGDCPAMWAWDKHIDRWADTTWGKQVSEWLAAIRPVLIIIDTLASAATGSDIVNQPQQYALGIAIRQWARALGDPTVLTISHTNQASASQELASRLHYLSRAGGNGLPGALRWIAGVTRLRGGEMDMVPGGHDYNPDDPYQNYVAFAVSKNNEMPRPLWIPERPLLIQMKPDGRLFRVPDYAELSSMEPVNGGGGNKQRRRREAKNEVPTGWKPTTIAGGSGRYQRAKDGE